MKRAYSEAGTYSRVASDMDDAIIVREWGADAFHRRVLPLEADGYVCRRETYKVIPEVNPETGQIVRLHTIEITRMDGLFVGRESPILRNVNVNQCRMGFGGKYGT